MCRVALLLLALLPVALSLQAQDTFWVNGIRYSIDYEDEYYWGTPDIITLKVISATGSTTYSGEIVIPETVKVNVSRYEGSYYGGNYDMFCQVTSIGEDAFRDCTGLTAVQLPKSIKTIGRNAFYGCTGLSELTIPNGVSSIGEQAFANCTSLTSMTLPNSVTSLGWNAFYSCTGLRNVTLSKNLTSLNGTFVGCTGLTTVSVPAGVQSLNTTFNGCTALTTVQLPRSLKSIEEAAFDGCSSLASIYLPEGVDYIGKQAFRNTALTSVELPSRVSKVFENAFEGCTQLTSVTSRNLTPPVMVNNTVFDGETYGTAALYVPAVAVAQYSGADWWKLFENIEGQTALDTHYDFEAGGIYYLITGSNTVEVTYKDTNYNSYSGNVTIPASVTYNGVTYSVTAIGTYAFNKCTGLTSVSMPATITSIGSFAFNGCNGLTSLNLPEALAAIGERAFMDCLGVTSLTIPENVTSIGEYAFSGIRNLTSLTWNARECWTNGNMITSSIATLTIGNEVVVIPGNLAYCSAITTVEIPQSVKFIGQEAFNGCNGVTSLTIPQNVVDIGTNAFANINNLTSLTWNARECWSNGNMATSGITTLAIGDEVKVLPNYMASNAQITALSIPESVTTIGGFAFYNCSGLTSVVIPDHVTYIGYSAFCNCNNLTEVTLGKSVETIDAYGLWNSPIRTLTWNARNVKVDGTGEYYDQYDYNHSIDIPAIIDYSRVTQLTIGNEVESLPNYFAYRCQLATVELPATVTAIGNYAFAQSGSLTSINLPAGLTSIGNHAFERCGSLTSAPLPASLMTIGDYAFMGCSGLTGIDLPATLTTVGAGAFTYCDGFTRLTVPASVTKFGQRAFTCCSGLESIVVDSANPVYDSRDNCNAMFKTANDSIMLVCNNSVLPNSMTIIPDSAFYGQTALTHFEIPSTVTYIGKHAFDGCTGITSITVPASVAQIGEYAFANCKQLATLTVEAGNPVYDSRDNSNAIIVTATNTLVEGSCGSVIPSSVTTIAKKSFLGRSPLNLAIPDGVLVIEDSAFVNSPLYGLTLGNTVKTIGASAFMGSNVSAVAIPDCVETIGTNAFANCVSLSDVTIGDGVTSMGKSAFAGCSNLVNVTLGHGLETIPDYTFSGCFRNFMWYPPIPNYDEDYVEDWYYPSPEDDDMYVYNHLYYDHYSQMVYIDSYLGYQQYTLEDYLQLVNSGGCTIFIPENIKSIGEQAFYRCWGLRTVDMAPNSVVSIGYEAFDGCNCLRTVVIPPSLKTVDYCAFANGGLANVKISDLAAWCDIDFDMYSSNPLDNNGHLFLNDEEIVDLVIPDGVTRVKECAFNGCYGFKSVTIGNSVKAIDGCAFSDCDSLQVVNIGDNVETIAEYAFGYCRGLKTINLGRGVKTIASGAFCDGSKVTSVTCLAETPPRATGYSAFSCYNTATLYVPEASVEAYKRATTWRQFTNIVGIPGGAGPGDVNGDGELSVSDVTMLINLIMSAGEEGIDGNGVADVNGDGMVNVSDIVLLIEMALNSTR